MNDIRLKDGSLFEINLNFLTVKILHKCGIDTLQKRYDETKDEAIGIEIVSKIIYAILRSNGKVIDEEQALMLIPMDDDVLMGIMERFAKEMEKLEKKQGAKQNLMK